MCGHFINFLKFIVWFSNLGILSMYIRDQNILLDLFPSYYIKYNVANSLNNFRNALSTKKKSKSTYILTTQMELYKYS